MSVAERQPNVPFTSRQSAKYPKSAADREFKQLCITKQTFSADNAEAEASRETRKNSDIIYKLHVPNCVYINIIMNRTIHYTRASDCTSSNLFIETVLLTIFQK